MAQPSAPMADFEVARDELRADIENSRELNICRCMLVPDTMPGEIFDRKQPTLENLYRHGTRAAEASGRFTEEGGAQSGIPDESNGTTEREIEETDRTRRFLRRILGHDDEYTRDIPHGARAAKILAILLTLETPVAPESIPWAHFTRGDYAPDDLLRDDGLPFNREVIRQLFQHETIRRQFADKQYEFSGIVLRESKMRELKDSENIQDRLPYMRDQIINHSSVDPSSSQTMHETLIFKGHLLFEGESTANNEHRRVARKEIKRSKKTSISKEWEILRMIHQKLDSDLRRNVIRPLACLVLPTTVNVFMDLADQDLVAFMAQNKRRYVEDVELHLRNMLDVAKALAAVHKDIRDKNGAHLYCYHLDLKPENILVCYTDREQTTSPQIVRASDYMFKVADFGASILTSNQPDAQKEPLLRKIFRLNTAPQKRSNLDSGQPEATKPQVVGEWSTCVPPELLAGEHSQVSAKSDVWAFGCVLCMFIAWVREGPEAVEDFRKSRVLHWNQLNEEAMKDIDRFVCPSSKRNSQPVLNEGVESWFRKLIKSLKATEFPEHDVYEELWNLLSQHVLRIEPKDRYTMSQFSKKLEGILDNYSTNKKKSQSRLGRLKPKFLISTEEPLSQGAYMQRGTTRRFSLAKTKGVRSCTVCPLHGHIAFVYEDSLDIFFADSFVNGDDKVPIKEVRLPGKYLASCALSFRHLWYVAAADSSALLTCSIGDSDGHEQLEESAEVFRFEVGSRIEMIAAHPTRGMLACLVRLGKERNSAREIRLCCFDGPGISQQSDQATCSPSAAGLSVWQSLQSDPPIDGSLPSRELKMFFSKDGDYLVLAEHYISPESPNDFRIIWWTCAENPRRVHSYTAENEGVRDRKASQVLAVSPVFDHYVLVVTHQSEPELLNLTNNPPTSKSMEYNSSQLLGPLCSSCLGSEGSSPLELMLAESGGKAIAKLVSIHNRRIGTDIPGSECLLHFRKLLDGLSCAMIISGHESNTNSEEHIVMLLIGCDGDGQIIEFFMNHTRSMP